MIDTWKFWDFFRSWINLWISGHLPLWALIIGAKHRKVLSMLGLKNVKQIFSFY